MAKTVDEYIASLGPEQAAVVSRLREVVRQGAPEAQEAIKWGQPVFSQGGPVCFIKAHKAHVNFGFWWGAMLDDPQGLLEGEGVKMRHVKVRSLEDINGPAFGALLTQALACNARLGDPTKTGA